MENKTWKPTTAGILSIVAGAMGVIGGIAIAVLAGAIAAGLKFVPEIPRIFGAVDIPLISGVGIPMIILGAVAIVGGIYALKRRVWGLALGGAICALLVPPGTVLGILAIIFVAMGKDEFE